MAKSKDNKVDLVKFRHKNERLWLLVTKETDKYYFGAVDNKPTEPGLKFGDKREVLNTDILDIDYVKAKK